MSRIKAQLKKMEKLNLKSGLNKINLDNSSILFGDREFVEQLKSFVQPICAAMILTKNGKILTINKTATSTGKISPEKDKTLLYVGGHLDISDKNEDSNCPARSQKHKYILSDFQAIPQ